MVHLLRSFALALIALLLAASSCTQPSPQSPPTPPMLVRGQVTGNEVCGDQGSLGTFACAPKPTTTPTAFLLSPPIRNTPNGPEPNETAVLTVTTQTAKNLDISVRVVTGAALIPQRQAPAALGFVPQVLGNYGEVAVAATDDGTTKTWTLTVRLSRCREWAVLQIAAVTPGSSSSSNFLSVVLFRNGNEVQTGCPAPTSRAKLVSIDPTHGAPGRTVILTGSGFSSSPVQVKFGSLAPVPATIDATNTRATVAVPQAVFGLVSVWIIDPAYGQTTSVSFTITGATPMINGISASHVPRGGLVTLTGVNFGGGMVIQLEPAAGPMVTVSPENIPFSATSVRFRVPLVNVGTARVKIGYLDETFSNVVSFVVDP